MKQDVATLLTPRADQLHLQLSILFLFLSFSVHDCGCSVRSLLSQMLTVDKDLYEVIISCWLKVKSLYCGRHLQGTYLPEILKTRPTRCTNVSNLFLE